MSRFTLGNALTARQFNQDNTEQWDQIINALQTALPQVAPDDLLDALAYYVTKDAEQQNHPAVRDILYAAAEHLREASFLYYASWK